MLLKTEQGVLVEICNIKVDFLFRTWKFITLTHYAVDIKTKDPN